MPGELCVSENLMLNCICISNNQHGVEMIVNSETSSDIFPQFPSFRTDSTEDFQSYTNITYTKLRKNYPLPV